MPMTEAGIDSGLTRDLYVSLGEPVDGGKAWIVRVYVKPFIDWIWYGCVLMALGGLLAVADRRYRAKVTEPAPPQRGACMKLKYLMPLALLPGAGGPFSRWAEPRPARGAQPADRQARARPSR